MPWCPKCKTEYREGFNICSDCGSALVEAEIEESVGMQKEEDEWVLLLQSQNEREAEMLEAYLSSIDIPVLRIDKGAGGYLKIYMGMNLLGVDLYVPKSKLEEAKGSININNISESLPSAEQAEQEKQNERTKENLYVIKRRKRVWILFFIILLINAIMWLLYRFNYE